MADTLRVLYVDDEPGLLEIGKLFLEESGNFSVTTIGSATAALNLISKERFDVIVSDYQMPEMDGITFLKQLKAAGNSTPFIIFTGKGREEVVIEALNEGADFYLQKGGEPKAQFAELANKIRYAVSRRSAELDLRESEDRYRHVVEDQTEFICRFLPDGTHIFVNEAYCRYFGLNREEITGTRFHPTIHPEDRENVARLIASLTPEHPLETIDQRIIMPDGSIQWQRWVDRVIFHADGSLKEYQSVGRDITDYKNVEEALKESENKLNAVIRGSPIPQFVIDKNHKVIHWNQALEEYSGISANEVIGTNQHWRAFYPEERPCMADLLVEGQIEKIQQWYSGKFTKSRFISGAYEATDFFPKIRGGTWLYFTAAPIKDLNGVMIGVVETLEDITERKRAEDALRESEIRFREQHQNNPLAIFTWQHRAGDFVLAGFNKAADTLTNGLVKDYLGKFASDLYSSRPEIVSEFRECFSERATISKEFISEHFLPGRFIKSTATFAPPDMVMVHMEDITGWKQTEKELHRAHKDYLYLLEHMKDVYYRSDTEGRLILASSSWANNLGYDDISECLGKSIADVFYADIGERKRFLADIYLNGSVSDYEVTLKKKDGTSLPVATSSYLYYDESGKVLGVEGTWRDITRRKRIEEALQESEEKYRGIFDTINDGLHIHEIDPDGKPGKFIEVNEIACRMLQYSREELLEHGPLDFVTEYHNRPLNEIIGELSSTGHAIFETEHRRKDGTVLPVEINSHVVRLQGKRMIVAVVRDITERKRAEETLADSELFNRGLVENLPEYIIVYGPDGKILYVNPATEKALGYNAEELVGTSVLSYVAEEQQEHVISMMKARHEVGEVPAYETDIMAQDGNRRSVITKGTPVRYHDSPAFLILLIDITERKELEKEMEYHAQELHHYSTSLATANKKLTLLSSITRHDINNQLMILTGYLTILEKKQPDATHNEYFQKITTAAKRISAMVKFTGEYEEIGIKAPTWQDCRTLVDAAAKQAHLGQVVVNNDLPAGTEVFADPLVVKVFYNLMDNAVRYGGKITTIRFSVEEAGDDHIIVGEDDGEGIPVEEKEKIFNRGFGKNTGLGLALSQEILSITGITIKETGEPGKGARFEMMVPKGMWRMSVKDVP